MSLETWFLKVKKTISHMGLTPSPKMKPLPVIKKSKVGVLAFEIAGLMSKLLHLWNSLSDKNMIRIRNESIWLEGVRKIVSKDEAFLLDLACAEMVENLSVIAKGVSRLSKKCEDSNLRSFDRLFEEFSNTGRVRTNYWVLSSKEMEAKVKKLDDYISLTSALHREMDELLALENGYKKSLFLEKDKVGFSYKDQKIIDQQQKILFQRQQIKYLKEKSLWCKSFDTVTSLLGKCVFTALSKIKNVFGINNLRYPISLPRSLSASAIVYPSDQNSCNFVSGPLIKTSDVQEQRGFFELYAKVLEPGSSTLGFASLALHYANLVIVIEKLTRSPQLIGEDARNHLYTMLPNSIRLSLRARLKRVRFSGDPVLAGEWRGALHKILGWLLPLAQNMIKWQSERSFEQHNSTQKSNVLLLQTLYFADLEITETAITELLVGLNYVWRYEREMNAIALFECGNFNGFLNS